MDLAFPQLNMGEAAHGPGELPPASSQSCLLLRPGCSVPNCFVERSSREACPSSLWGCSQASACPAPPPPPAEPSPTHINPAHLKLQVRRFLLRIFASPRMFSAHAPPRRPSAHTARQPCCMPHRHTARHTEHRTQPATNSAPHTVRHQQYTMLRAMLHYTLHSTLHATLHAPRT